MSNILRNHVGGKHINCQAFAKEIRGSARSAMSAKSQIFFLYARRKYLDISIHR